MADEAPRRLRRGPGHRLTQCLNTMSALAGTLTLALQDFQQRFEVY